MTKYKTRSKQNKGLLGKSGAIITIICSLAAIGTGIYYLSTYQNILNWMEDWGIIIDSSSAIALFSLEIIFAIFAILFQILYLRRTTSGIKIAAGIFGIFYGFIIGGVFILVSKDTYINGHSSTSEIENHKHHKIWKIISIKKENKEHNLYEVVLFNESSFENKTIFINKETLGDKKVNDIFEMKN